MKYLFAKNDPAEIRKAADQISDFCSRIEEKHSVDTSVEETIFFTLAGAICVIIGVVNLMGKFDSETIVCIGIAFIILASIISLPIVFVKGVSGGEGLIGHVINKKWGTPEILHAEEELEALSHKLSNIEFLLQMSKKIEDYYRRFGDSIKVNISRDGEDSELFRVVFFASLHKTVKDKVTYSDKFRETFMIKEDTMLHIFKDEDTIDFSWIDNHVEDAKNTFKQLLGQKQPLLESIKEGTDLEYYV